VSRRPVTSFQEFRAVFDSCSSVVMFDLAF
jgi:hypothetical protein